ncbi:MULTISPECIES: hypothetical protein [Terrabacteria group]|uniref:hypothetical protein n=1 Tax=Bacillati TaxID=1783272 RepID=UPI00193A6A63|nr:MULTISPECIES: hypothetical protein [Terrabacteria group]MBW9211959.1 hypothetical protein [Trueperella sp. zg.1013]QRG87241.1 hypothetical protein JOS54_02730 [Bulleidia sp. zg-1006]
MKLLSKKKFILIVVLVFLFLIFKDTIHTALFFDINSPDLLNSDGAQIKLYLLKDSISLVNLRFNFMSYVSFLIPILLIILGYDYKEIKNNLLKYNIGKNKAYNKKLFFGKMKFAVFASLIVLFAFSFVMSVSIFFNGSTTNVVDEFVFDNSSVLSKIFNSDYGFLLFTVLSVMFSIIINGFFYYILIDYIDFIKGTLLFISFIWIGSMILYRFLPFYLVPMSSIMITSYGNISIPKMLSPYIFHIMILVYILSSRKYEVK